MTELHRRLLRDVPERRAARSGDFATEPRALRNWVAALPLANFLATARMLVDGLRAMNALRIPPGERLDALEILRGPINQLASLVDKQIVGASFPLPPQRSELGTLAQEFQSELALGYRMTLHDYCAPNGSVPLLKGKSVALSAARALGHCGARLHKAYLLYRTPPKGCWQSLHDVYRFTASLGLDSRSVDDDAFGSATPRQSYVHAILLALANPYRFTQRELLDLIAFTRTLAPYPELRRVAGGQAAHPIDVERDAGPGYIPEERTTVDDGVLELDLGPVLAFIDEQVRMVPPGIRLATFRVRGGAPAQVEVDLVRRIVDGWTSDGTRGHRRLAGGHVLQTVIGLHDLHFVLAGNEDFDGFLRKVRGTSISLSERDTAASWVVGSGEQMRTQRMSAHIVDQGLGGYRLVWERGASGESVRAKVGELVGLSLPEGGDTTPDWMVGSVRWMRIDDEGRIDAGIELLARRSLAVGAAAVDAAGQARADMRGILLAPLREEESAIYSSLLTPGLFEREPASIEMTIPADPHRWPSAPCVLRVQGAGTMDSTGSYLMFALPSLDLPDDGIDAAPVLAGGPRA
ncbi:hypothetical protein [Dokdonella sp.]|uniref:hypothetical protein n=1 Tax=Dokdonella sp. TaxID=2291710 RepID=UPI0025C15F6E|nr:hypothetical protein [Dokdonella sp.]MBX3693116.1 hypothetical protein [Dokdonella sp.]MCW5566939.1 hypothetical protein [Dokdonella sp.]